MFPSVGFADMVAHSHFIGGPSPGSPSSDISYQCLTRTYRKPRRGIPTVVSSLPLCCMFQVYNFWIIQHTEDEISTRSDRDSHYSSHRVGKMRGHAVYRGDCVGEAWLPSPAAVLRYVLVYASTAAPVSCYSRRFAHATAVTSARSRAIGFSTGSNRSYSLVVILLPPVPSRNFHPS